MKYLVIILLIFMAFVQSCYYDKAFIDPSNICDTTSVTYSGTVRPILITYCTGCHTGPNAPSGVQLENYTGVKARVTTNKLFASITHAPGASPMPKNANKLSDCNIAKIRIWIAAGAPNN